MIEADTVMVDVDAARRKLTSGRYQLTRHFKSLRFGLWPQPTNPHLGQRRFLRQRDSRERVQKAWYRAAVEALQRSVLPHAEEPSATFIWCTGTYHNALDDARVQTNHLGDICRELKLT